MLVKTYLLTGIALIGLYGVMGFLGWEYDTPPRQSIPASARNTPGVYRSHHFWYSGYRGGK